MSNTESRGVLATFCAAADIAAARGDVRTFSASIRAAVPLVAETFVAQLVEVADAAEVDLRAGIELWNVVRLEVRPRR